MALGQALMGRGVLRVLDLGAIDPEVLAASSRTVRVSSIACGYGIEGSGWVAAPDLVVTNAHVVAGGAATRVQRSMVASSSRSRSRRRTTKSRGTVGGLVLNRAIPLIGSVKPVHLPRPELLAGA